MISIIIPCYNINNTLFNKCIESIIHQSIGLNNIQVILINDCSTDNQTYDILNSYKNVIPNIIIINLENNVGPGQARNKGIEYATGEYLLFLDSDDNLVNNNVLEKAIENSSADIIMGEYLYKNIIINKVQNKIIDNPKNYCEFLYYNPALGSKLFKTSFIKNNAINFKKYRMAEDALFLTEAFINAKQIELKDIIFYQYNDNNNSLTKTKKFQHLYDEINTKYDMDILLLNHNYQLSGKIMASANYIINNSLIYTKMSFDEYIKIYDKLKHILIHVNYCIDNKKIADAIKNYSIEDSYKIINNIL